MSSQTKFYIKFIIKHHSIIKATKRTLSAPKKKKGGGAKFKFLLFDQDINTRGPRTSAHKTVVPAWGGPSQHWNSLAATLLGLSRELSRHFSPT